MIKKLIFFGLLCSFFTNYNNEDLMDRIRSLDYLQTLPDHIQEFITGPLSEQFIDPIDPEVVEFMSGCTSTPILSKHQLYNVPRLVDEFNQYELKIKSHELKVKSLEKESDQYKSDINKVNCNISDLVHKMNIVMYRHKIGQSVPDFEEKVSSFRSELADLNKTLFSLQEHYTLVGEMLYDLENDDSK